MSESKIVLTIDDNIKKEAEAVFSGLGLNMETAINIFLAKAVNEGGLPFDVKQKKYSEDPAFLSSHFIMKSALYEVNEYLKDRFNEEPSFHLACDTKGVEHEDIGKLFILFSKNTENINQEDFTTNHIDSLVELAITAVPSIKRLSSDQLRDIVNAFINNYYLIR